MKCDHCNKNAKEDNIGRVCAYQFDPLIEQAIHGYNNELTCNCCEECRDVCHNQKLKEDGK
jgi:hypothetical protein